MKINRKSTTFQLVQWAFIGSVLFALSAWVMFSEIEPKKQSSSLKPAIEEEFEVSESYPQRVKSIDLIEEEAAWPEEKQASTFQFNPDKDTVLEGPQGVRVTIPANSFDAPEGEVLTLALKEYTSKSDLLFSELSTNTTDGRLLESGGTVHLAVSNAAGDARNLKADARLELAFPKEEHKPGMLLFDGGIDGENVVWEEQEINLDQEILIFNEEPEIEMMPEIFTIVENMPEYPGGEKALFTYLKENVQYPPSAIRKRIEGNVYINFIVSRCGDVLSPRLLRGVDPLVDSCALLAILQMPRWKPGRQRGKRVDVSYNIPVHFQLKSGGQEVVARDSTYFAELAAIRKQYNDFLKDSTSNMPCGGADQDDRIDSTLRSRDKAYEAHYYVMSTSNLGWINCDRYLRSNRSLVDVQVPRGDSSVEASLVFQSINSCLSAKGNSQSFLFNNVPLGEKAWLWVTQVENGEPYVAFTEVELGAFIEPGPFHKLTKSRMEWIQQQINPPEPI